MRPTAASPARIRAPAPTPARLGGLTVVGALLGVLLGASLGVLAGCGASAVPAPAASAPPPPADLRSAAGEVVAALAERDFARLAGLVHPQQGVRFSPYAHVDPDHQAVLTPDDLRAAARGARLERDWGRYDGTGRPIHLSFQEYVDRFVDDAPYAAAGQVAVDTRQGAGTALDDAKQAYPGGRIVEYHMPGTDPRSGGLDWKSLRLVFEEGSGEAGGGEAGRWYLVAVIHDQWTI